MNTSEASVLARELMNQHGLGHWVFQFDRAVQRFGYCSQRRQLISLSEPLTLVNPAEQVRDTILHEIAHALTPGHHHDTTWKLKAMEIGARAERCGVGQGVQGKYVAACPDCSKRFYRHRRPKTHRTIWHTPCHCKENKGILTFQEVGYQQD